jgi:hypothetical protein
MRFDRFPFSPQLVHARWVLGQLPSEEVPQLAQTALANGYDGKYTRRIAGLINPNSGDLQPLMKGFLSELGIERTLSIAEAGWSLARFIAEAITQHRIAPYEGARFIGKNIVNEIWPNEQHPLLIFEGEASEYEDCGSYSDDIEKTRRTIEHSIIKDARKLLATAR